MIPSKDYLKNFASDRRHMIKENGEWIAPPPSYACVQNNKNEIHTLERFWTMHEEAGNQDHGRVLDERSFLLQMQFLSKAD